MGPAEIHDSLLRDGLNDAFSGEHSGWHTEDLVTHARLTREDQDRFAARSQQRFSAAQQAGKFTAEIVAVELPGKKGVETFATDEAPRPDTTFESAGQASPGLSRRRDHHRRQCARPEQRRRGDDRGRPRLCRGQTSAGRMARLVAYGVGAVEPGMFGLGPVPAIRKALARAGWKLGDVERFEINEAFAAVPLAVARELGIAMRISSTSKAAPSPTATPLAPPAPS